MERERSCANSESPHFVCVCVASGGKIILHAETDDLGVGCARPSSYFLEICAKSGGGNNLYSWRLRESSMVMRWLSWGDTLRVFYLSGH